MRKFLIAVILICCIMLPLQACGSCDKKNDPNDDDGGYVTPVDPVNPDNPNNPDNPDNPNNPTPDNPPTTTTVEHNFGLVTGEYLNLSEYANYIGDETSLKLLLTGESKTVSITDNKLPLTDLSGVYELTVKGESGTAKLTFDAYDNAVIDWGVTAESASKLGGIFGNEIKTTKVAFSDGVYTVTSDGTEGFSFGWLGKHSAEYYEMYTDIGYEVTFSYRIQTKQKDGSTYPVKYANVAFADEQLWATVEVDKWQTAKISLESIIENKGAVLIQTDSEYSIHVEINETWGESLGGHLIYSGKGAAVNDIVSATWEFKNFEFKQDLQSIKAIEAEDTLIDKKGKTDLSFETLLLNEAQRKTFATYKSIGEVSWAIDGNKLNTADATDIEGEYLLTATLTCNNESVTVFSGNIDFYNSADGMVWQLKDSLSESNLFIKNTKNCTGVESGVVTENIPEGASASVYYKVSNLKQNSEKTGWFANVVGLHSKAYYEMWQKTAEKYNQKINVTYEFYAYSEKLDGTKVGGSICKPFKSDGDSGHTIGWHSYTISLDAIIENWKYLDKTDAENHQYMIGNFEAFYYGRAGTMYFGNFGVEFEVGETLGDTETATLIDLKDKTGNYDLATLLTAEEKTKLGDITSYTWYLDGEKLESSSVPVTELDGLYEISLGFVEEPYSVILYKNAVDFYNSADGIVWQRKDKLKLDNLLIKDINDCKGVESIIVTGSDIPENATASAYYKISNPKQKPDETNREGINVGWSLSVLGLHSKEYYKMWQKTATAEGKTIEISFDYYTIRVNNDDKESGSQMYYNFAWHGETKSAKTWHTVTMTLDTILDEWDKGFLTGTQHTSYEHNMIQNGDAVYYGNAQTMYIGNFTVTTSSATAE